LERLSGEAGSEAFAGMTIGVLSFAGLTRASARDHRVKLGDDVLWVVMRGLDPRISSFVTLTKV
jgi:hypothetical protein